MQGAVPWPTPFSTLLGQLKDDSINTDRQINVSGLLVFHFHGKFAPKFEMREFYELLHSSGANSQAST